MPVEKTKLEVADDHSRRFVKTEEYRYFLPIELEVNANADVSSRKIGIYQGQIFNTQSTLQGKFAFPEIDESDVTPLWSQAFISISVSDARGIKAISPVNFADNASEFQAGSHVSRLAQGLHAIMDISTFSEQAQNIPFSFTLDLMGSKSFALVPAGKDSSFTLTSNWPHPNFIGAFLPDRHTITEQGFTAQWRSNWFANNLNEHLIQFLKEGDYMGRYYYDSGSETSLQKFPTFRTGLVETVNHYTLNERSVKYAILFIGLTFIGFFLMEVLQGLRIHPVQYLIVGATLTIFYLLLLAFSERVGFNAAYLIAATTCVGLSGFYGRYVLRSTVRSGSFCAVLAALYATLWLIMQSEDNALLMGTLLLLLILTSVIIFTRRVDWYQLETASGHRFSRVKRSTE